MVISANSKKVTTGNFVTGIFITGNLYDTQLKYLFPVINKAQEHECRNQIDKLSSKEVVNLDGDGRCDSAGHCAKYGTYTLMDEDTRNVVAFEVVQLSKVTSSNAMEKEGFSRCIELLEAKA